MAGSDRGKKSRTLVRATEQIEPSILTFRGHKVLLDADLADVYDVTVGALNQAVKRNSARFPSDFMFQLSWEEARAVKTLRSQSVILKTGRGGHSKYLPYAFTEQGVGMLSSVLHSKRAVQVNIEIMRTFVRLRRMLSACLMPSASSWLLRRRRHGRSASSFRKVPRSELHR